MSSAQKEPEFHKDIDEASATWRAVREWATRELQDAVASCKRSGLGIERTENARGKVAVLESLLNLPVPPEPPEPADAGMSGGQELM